MEHKETYVKYDLNEINPEVIDTTVLYGSMKQGKSEAFFDINKKISEKTPNKKVAILEPTENIRDIINGKYVLKTRSKKYPNPIEAIEYKGEKGELKKIQADVIMLDEVTMLSKEKVKNLIADIDELKGQKKIILAALDLLANDKKFPQFEQLETAFKTKKNKDVVKFRKLLKTKCEVCNHNFAEHSSLVRNKEALATDWAENDKFNKYFVTCDEHAFGIYTVSEQEFKKINNAFDAFSKATTFSKANSKSFSK